MYKTQKSRTNSLPPLMHRRGFTLIGPKDHDRNVVSGRKRMHRAAFTLIELIVVMAVIGVLVLLAAPKFLNYTARARETQIRNDIKVLESKIDEYLIKHDTLPDEWDEAISGDGQLYDRTGPINSLPPGDFKVVDRTFYPETNLGGNFYSDDNGIVVYESDKSMGESNPPVGGIKCSLLRFEVDGPIPVSFADIDEDLENFSRLKEALDYLISYKSRIGFYKFKNGTEVLNYAYVESGLGSNMQIVFMSFEDLEASYNGGMEPKSYTHPHFVGMVDLSNGTMELLEIDSDVSILPKYFATYDNEYNIFDDECFIYTGLEDVDTDTDTGIEDEVVIDVVNNLVLTDRNLYYDSRKSEKFNKFRNTEWNEVYEMESLADRVGTVLYTNDHGIYLTHHSYLTDKPEVVKLENAVGVYNTEYGYSYYVTNDNKVYSILSSYPSLYQIEFLANLPVGLTHDNVQEFIGQDFDTNLYILSKDGKVYAGGENNYGQLGTGATGNKLNNFQQIPGMSNIKKISMYNTGEFNTGAAIYALQSNGDILRWGWLGKNTIQLTPTVVRTNVINFIVNSFKEFHVLTDDGEVLKDKDGTTSKPYGDIVFSKIIGTSFVDVDNNWHSLYSEDEQVFTAERVFDVQNNKHSSGYNVIEVTSNTYKHLYHHRGHVEESLPTEVTGSLIGVMYGKAGFIHYITNEGIWSYYIGSVVG